MTADLQAIKARRAAITPGEWGVRPNTDLIVRGPWIVASVSLSDDAEARATAAFIAAAPADIDALLAEVERLTAERDALAGQLAEAQDDRTKAERKADDYRNKLSAATHKLKELGFTPGAPRLWSGEPQP